MLENWIDKHLKKQGFMRVPESWSKDYRDITEKKLATDKLIRALGEEYNTLLKEFAEGKNIQWLKENLAEVEIDTKGLNKEQLIEAYVNAFKVDFVEVK